MRVINKMGKICAVMFFATQPCQQEIIVPDSLTLDHFGQLSESLKCTIIGDYLGDEQTKSQQLINDFELVEMPQGSRQRKIPTLVMLSCLAAAKDLYRAFNKIPSTQPLTWAKTIDKWSLYSYEITRKLEKLFPREFVSKIVWLQDHIELMMEFARTANPMLLSIIDGACLDVNQGVKFLGVKIAPLETAVRKGVVGAIAPLIARGADLDEVNYGSNVLESAIYNNNVEMVKELIRCGARLEVPDYITGFTPLLTAVNLGFLPIVKVLLQDGANILFRNQYGTGALDLAFARNDAPMIALLQSWGAQ